MKDLRKIVRRLKSRIPYDELLYLVHKYVNSINFNLDHNNYIFYRYHYNTINLVRIVNYCYHNYLITYNNIDDFKINVAEILIYRFFYNSHNNDDGTYALDLYPILENFRSTGLQFSINEVKIGYDNFIKDLTEVRLKDYIIDVNFIDSQISYYPELFEVLQSHAYEEALELFEDYMVRNKIALKIEDIITKDIVSPISIFNYPVSWDIYLLNEKTKEIDELWW